MMFGCKAAMISYTKANHACRILQRYGLLSEIRRLEHLGPQGCGYVLAVQENYRRVSEILSQEGISFGELQEGRDAWRLSILITRQLPTLSRRRYGRLCRRRWRNSGTPDEAATQLQSARLKWSIRQGKAWRIF